MSGSIQYSEIAVLTHRQFENGEIDAHCAEQRLIDEGWNITAIGRFLGFEDGEG